MSWGAMGGAVQEREKLTTETNNKCKLLLCQLVSVHNNGRAHAGNDMMPSSFIQICIHQSRSEEVLSVMYIKDILISPDM